MPVKSTIAMDLAKKESRGMALGVSGSVNQLGSIAGFITLAGMASTVYFRDIADSPEEVVATLSTGVSVNHVISMLIGCMPYLIMMYLLAVSCHLEFMNKITTQQTVSKQ